MGASLNIGVGSPTNNHTSFFYTPVLRAYCCTVRRCFRVVLRGIRASFRLCLGVCIEKNSARLLRSDLGFVIARGCGFEC